MLGFADILLDADNTEAGKPQPEFWNCVDKQLYCVWISRGSSQVPGTCEARVEGTVAIGPSMPGLKLIQFCVLWKLLRGL